MQKEQLFKHLFWIFVVALFLIVFKSWFLPNLIFGGDFYFPPFKEEARGLPSFPYAWNGQKGNGLGGYAVSTLWIDTFAQIFPIFLIQRGLPSLLVQKFVFLFPFLALSFFSGIFLFKMLFPQEERVRFLVPLVFGLNAYILMIVGGGQIGIGLAYALAPLVLGFFIKTIQTSGFKLQTLAGLALALQVLLDLRLALLTVGIFFLYLLFQYGLAIRKHIRNLVLPFLIAVGLHSYWLVPAILIKKAALPAGYGEAGWVEFLSFADFSNSFSLLHPNWPENIFGKTYFVRPEFLFLPILAFISLLFINGLKSLRVKKNILFFAFLGLIGAFLAKGSKPPFGEVYLWLFKYFPGMNMFRDPTKFYLLTALSYSLLVPFSLEEITKRFKKLNPKPYTLFAIFILYWLFLIRPAWLGQLGGTFKAKTVPPEYVILKDFVHNQEEFFRTFWVPKKQRFGVFSDNHPAIEGLELPSEEELALMGVKYVIVPFDSEGEIFLKDRKYDPKLRLALEEELDKVSWLKKIDVADKITVYETPTYKDHFFIDLSTSSPVNELTSWRMINPTKYIVSVKINQPPVTLVFSEAYDELWQAKIEEKTISSTMFDDLNSFTIEQTGDFEIIVEFAAQKYVYWGLTISGLTALCCSYFYLRRNENKV